MQIRSNAYRPRDMRGKYVGSLAFQAARAKGFDAMGATLAQIDAEFGNAAIVNDLKLRVERAILWGPTHPAIRARFSIIARRYEVAGFSDALENATQQYRYESSTNLRGGERVRETVLILRWLRRTGRTVYFRSIIRDLLQ